MEKRSNVAVKLNSAKSLLDVDDKVIKEVALEPPYSGVVYVKSMTGEEWETYQESIIVEDESGKRKVNLKMSRAKMIVCTVCDSSGNLLFAQEDIPALMKKSNKFLENIVKEASFVNGIGDNPDKKN